MIALLQRVTSSSVSVNKDIKGSIGKGLTILLGVSQGDSETQADYLAEKAAQLRIFSDENDKMNLSLLDIGGEALVVSQFTLCADCKKGRRPSFTGAQEPHRADELYRYFCQKLLQIGVKKVETGVFGADMQLSIVNDGPVTIWLDTKEIMPKG